MIRLFTALEIPDLSASRLMAMQDGPRGLRWQPREALHITLAFIGEIEEPQAADLDAELARIASPGFDVRLKGAGVFGAAKPHALWAGVALSAPLEALFEKNQSAMRRAGLQPEKRRYVPHVTLARAKGLAPEAAQEWLRIWSLFDGGSFPASRFVLFSSHPGREGPHYELERVYPLGPATP